MDKLQVIQLAQEKGGRERRDAIEKLMIYARNLGCNIEAGGGRLGGINFRYGGIGYAESECDAYQQKSKRIICNAHQWIYSKRDRKFCFQR